MATIKYLYKEYPTLASRCMKCWALTHVAWPTGKTDVTPCNCEIEAVEPIRIALERLMPKETGTLTNEELSDLGTVVNSVDKNHRRTMSNEKWIRAFAEKHGAQFIRWSIRKIL